MAPCHGARLCVSRGANFVLEPPEATNLGTAKFAAAPRASLPVRTRGRPQYNSHSATGAGRASAWVKCVLPNPLDLVIGYHHWVGVG